MPDKTRWIGNPIGPWARGRGPARDALTAARAADDYVPGHGDRTFDVTHYDLDLEYKVEGNHLAGRRPRSSRGASRTSTELAPRPARPARSPR